MFKSSANVYRDSDEADARWASEKNRASSPESESHFGILTKLKKTIIGRREEDDE